ncbi:MAG TPA: DinB family protein [Flavisolibacter sp.]|jgi:uncharacterized damage-inducible protein DinB|nr:DinB family protein [Flavisolibacter sp.]
MEPKLLLEAIEQNVQKMQQVLQPVAKDLFNRKPSDGGWSAAQVTDHIIQLEAITLAALKSEGAVSTRPPDEKIALIRSVMESDVKRVAPEIVMPSEAETDPQEQLAAFKKQSDILKQVVEATDLQQACLQIKHPGFGTLTKWEWLAFCEAHTRRHLIQMERLLPIAASV